MKRGIFNICIVIVVVYLIFLLSSCNIVEATSKDFKFTINTDKVTCTITGLEDPAQNHIVIPSKIGKYSVNKIADGAFRGTEIQEVELPDTIIEIGKEAFAECYYLEAIDLPSSLQKIGEGAFSYCSSIRSIDIPGSVRFLLRNTFAECFSLESVSFNAGINRIEEAAFYRCSSLGQLSFPSTLRYIGDQAFMGCDSLKKIVLPEGLMDMGYNVFSLCTNLEEISFPSTIYGLSLPFAIQCPQLESFVVDSTNQTFQSNDGVLYNDRMSILAAYPSGKRDVEFDVPYTVVEIFNVAFAYNDYIQTINIPSSVKSLGPGVFADSNNLKTINYDGTVIRWFAIQKDSEWDFNSSDFTIYCTDGQISKDGTVTYK